MNIKYVEAVVQNKGKIVFVETIYKGSSKLT